MDGFFVTINCSKILDSNETSYKIFIDKSKMSIVYELVEWIRFIFSLERCFFLMHENSVIHELEDIKVLEILNSVEIRPCLRSNCIHTKMEKNLFSKLNLFNYWNGIRVHKLFQARYNCMTRKVSQNQENHLNIKEKSTSFQSYKNFTGEINKSQLDHNQAITSPSKLTASTEGGGPEVLETVKEGIGNEHQLNLEEVNTSLTDKNKNSHEIESKGNFSSHNLESLTYSNQNNLNLSALNSVSKKQKIQSESRKNSKRIGIPFSVGALLSNIRQEAQFQELKEKQEVGEEGKSFSSIYSGNANAEDKNLDAKNTYMHHIDGPLKSKRKRKHKKQNLKVDLSSANMDLSWDNFVPTIKAKPNHIRFDDTDEIMETEVTENNAKSFDDRLTDFNSSRVSNAAQQIINLTPELTPLVNKNEIPGKTETEEETCEKSIDQNSELLDFANQTNSDTKKQELNDSQQNFLDLESLKQKIKQPKICLRFY